MPSTTPRSARPDASTADESKRLARSSPAGLGLATDRTYRIPPHIDLIDAEIVEAIFRAQAVGDDPEVLVVEVGPRHGKSELISVLTPAWFLGTFPDRKVILASYEADFAATWGRRARGLLEEHGPSVWGVSVDQTSRARNRWDLLGRKGGMITAGVGGPVTGKGANCLPGETLVETEVGPVAIETLVQSPHRPRVAVKTSDGRVGYRRIIASRSSRADELIIVITDSGHRVRATGEHRFFVSGRGYVAAADLRPGDRLAALPDRAAMRAMRGAGGTRPSLPSVLRGDAASGRDDHLRLVWRGGDQEGLRSAQGDQARSAGRVLLKGLFAGAPRDQASSPVPNVRSAGAEKDNGVLLGGLSEGGAADPAPALRTVWGGLRPNELPAPVLLPPLRQRGSLHPDAGGGQLAFQGSVELCEVVSRDAAGRARAGRVGVCGVWAPGREGVGDSPGLEALAEAQRADDPPHRRGPGEQPSGEPGDALRDLPRGAPQVREVTVSRVERSREGGVAVYDLQVEGESCFFAGGLLVHNCLIIDDPIKNAEQALSETIRSKHIDWWLTTARTRLEPGAVVICLMTRWHENDLGGYLLENEPRAHELRLPALALEDDPLGREPGEALWPERYSRAYLESTRERVGAYWFSAMYMGRPTPDEGGIFNRRDFRYFTVEDDQAVLHYPEGGSRTWALAECQKRTYVDLAASEKTTADYTVATNVLVTPEKDLLIDTVVRDRIPGPEQPDFLAGNYTGLIKVETIGYQTTLIQELRRRGLPVEPLYPDKDKVTRAAAAGALYRGGKVYHRRAARWLADFEAELLAFPAGEHDDQVDTIAYAARDLPDVGAPVRTQKRKGRTEMGGLLSREL